MDKKNISKFMKFLETLPDEFAILCMSDAVIGNPDLKKTKAYIDFDVKHQELTL
jgi:hypothetical protein